MKINEIEINIMNAPQGYFLANAISKDLNFSIGLPALFEKTYNMKKKIEAFYTDIIHLYMDINLGEAVRVENVFNLVVKESSYDKPDKNKLIDAIIDMKEQMESDMITKLAIPKICCGRNGLDWNEVKTIFEIVFKDTDVQILVCVQ